MVSGNPLDRDLGIKYINISGVERVLPKRLVDIWDEGTAAVEVCGPGSENVLI